MTRRHQLGEGLKDQGPRQERRQISLRLEDISVKLTVPQKRKNTGATSFYSVIKRESSARGLLGTHPHHAQVRTHLRVHRNSSGGS